MGVLSLLCCSASSDDGEDKYLTRNQNETQNQSATQTKQPEQSKNLQQLKQSPQRSLLLSLQKTQLAANNNNSPPTNQNNKQPTSHKAPLTAPAPAPAPAPHPTSTSTSQSAHIPTTTPTTPTTLNNATSNGSANVSRDKVHLNGVSKTNSAANNYANVNETVPLKKKNLLDEDVDDDDDPSIHETDTITNTNGDSTNNTPKSSTNNADLTLDVLAKEQKLKQAKQNPDAVSAGDVIAQVSPNEQPPPKPTNLTAGSNSNSNNNNGNQIDTDVDEYSDDDDDEEEEDGNGARDDVSYKSETSTLDLTRLQTGQAYNQETGYLLGPKPPKLQHRKCLILDLDETLVHSSFKYLRTADFVIPVEIDNQVHHVYVIKRPGVDEFLRKVGQWYEVVIFTASVSKYGDPLLNKLDLGNLAIHHRLFRDSCYNYQGNFIKNLSQVGRPLEDIIIIDNSPASYIFHPDHSIPISSWFSDSHDNELLDLLPFLEDLAKPNVDDVALVLDISL